LSENGKKSYPKLESMSRGLNSLVPNTFLRNNYDLKLRMTKNQEEINHIQQLIRNNEKLKQWAENKYDVSNIEDDDVDLIFSLLRRLYEAEEPLALKVFKQEIGKGARSEGYAPDFVVLEGYFDYFHDQDEMLSMALIPEEAAVMKEISQHTEKEYHPVYSFDADDEVRRRYDMSKYYFNIYKGRIYEMDLELNQAFPVFPDSISQLQGLERLHIFANDTNEILFNTDNIFESIILITLYSHEDIKSFKRIKKEKEIKEQKSNGASIIQYFENLLNKPKVTLEDIDLYDVFPNLGDVRRRKLYRIRRH